MGEALVTGASSGIGRAITLALQAAGHTVVAIGRNAEALRQLSGLGIQCVQVDLADKSALRAALAGLSPDILVNIVGMMPPLGHFCDAQEVEIDRTIAVEPNRCPCRDARHCPRHADAGAGPYLFHRINRWPRPFR